MCATLRSMTGPWPGATSDPRARFRLNVSPLIGRGAHSPGHHVSGHPSAPSKPERLIASLQSLFTGTAFSLYGVPSGGRKWRNSPHSARIRILRLPVEGIDRTTNFKWVRRPSACRANAGARRSSTRSSQVCRKLVLRLAPRSGSVPQLRQTRYPT